MTDLTVQRVRSSLKGVAAAWTTGIGSSSLFLLVPLSRSFEETPVVLRHDASRGDRSTERRGGYMKGPYKDATDARDERDRGREGRRR